jgi:serine/threonine protein phosphatase PrpC
MGGMGSGDVASQAAIRSIANYLLNVMPWETPAQQRPQLGSVPGLRASSRRPSPPATPACGSEATRPGVSSHLGTTLTLAFVMWPVLYVAHVGDSRCYLSRGDALMRLTTDHTVAEEMKERGFPARDVPDGFTNVLWNALGGQERTPTPQIQKFALEPGDALVLCTDGLTKHVTDAEIAAVVQKAATPADACGSSCGWPTPEVEPTTRRSSWVGVSSPDRDAPHVRANASGGAGSKGVHIAGRARPGPGANAHLRPGRRDGVLALPRDGPAGRRDGLGRGAVFDRAPRARGPAPADAAPANQELLESEVEQVSQWDGGSVGLLGGATFVWLASSVSARDLRGPREP